MKAGKDVKNGLDKAEKNAGSSARDPAGTKRYSLMKNGLNKTEKNAGSSARDPAGTNYQTM